MKKFLLNVFILISAGNLFIKDISCTLTKGEKDALKKHASAFEKFMRRIPLREREEILLAQECHINNKQDSCLELEESKMALVQETMEYYEFDPVIYILRYDSVYMNRKELYHDDEDILGRYKEKMPQEIYEPLEAFEQHLKTERNRTIVEDGMISLDPFINTILPLEKLNDLKKNNPECYKAFIKYFAESTAARCANTKTVAIDSNEKMVALWKRGFDQRTQEEQEKIETMLTEMKDHPALWETNNLSLEEVRKELQETK